MMSKKYYIVTVEYENGAPLDELPYQSFLFDNERKAKAFVKKVKDHPASVFIRECDWFVIMQDVKQATVLFDEFMENNGYEIDPIEELLNEARSTGE